MGINISTGAGSGIVGKLLMTGFGLFFAFIGTQFVKQEWRNLQETKAMQEWTKTTCTIVSSNVEDDGEDFRLALSYQYTVDGQTYTGERYGKQEYYTAESIGKIEQIHKQLPVGKDDLDCYYDPRRPTDAALERPTVKGARSSVGFTLLFPAFGLFFASIPWVRRRKSGSVKRLKTGSERSPKIVLIIFGLVFAGVSCLMIKPLLITPFQKTRDAQHWNSVPATVVSSKVKSHSDDDGTTYSVYIAYRYEINGTEYFGDQYTFMGGSSSGYNSKAEIVRTYPEGSEITVYMNPANPSESVILRDYSKSLLFGLIPLLFLLIGIAVIISGVRSKKPALDETQSLEHIVTLKTPSPAKKAGGIALFTAFWLAVVYFLAHSDAPLLFPIVFGFFGIILLGMSIHAILAIFNPRPVVEITPGNIHPGTSVAVRWRISGRTDRIDALKITLRCARVTTETSGSGKNRSTRVVKTPIHEEELLQTDNQAEIAQGTLQFTIPRDQPSSRPGSTNGIQWHLVFHGDIARWPDMKDELPFIVYPND